MFPHQEHVWIIGCIFNTPYPTCAFSVHWSCIAHNHPLLTPLLPLSCIDLYLVSSSQHVFFTLCLVEFCFSLGLSFIFSFMLLPSCIIIIVRTFISCSLFSLTPLSIHVKKRESILQSSIPKSFVISIWLLCTSLGEKFYFSCTFVGGEIFHIGDANTKGKTLC